MASFGRRLSGLRSRNRGTPTGRVSIPSVHSSSGSTGPIYAQMTLMQLREACTSKGLPRSGRKADLLKRLSMSTQQNQPQDVLCQNVLSGTSNPSTTIPGTPTQNFEQESEQSSSVPAPSPDAVASTQLLVASKRPQRKRKRRQRQPSVRPPPEDRRLVDIIQDTTTGEESKSAIERKKADKLKRKMLREAKKKKLGMGDQNEQEGGEVASSSAQENATDPSQDAARVVDSDDDLLDYDISANPNALQVQWLGGRMVVKDASMNYESTEPNYDDYQRVEENTRGSFSSKAHTNWESVRRWKAEETSLFYAALAQYGMNFDFIASLFPDRTHKQIKRKFKKEESRHRDKVDKALKKTLPIAEVEREKIRIHTEKRKEAAERHKQSKIEQERKGFQSGQSQKQPPSNPEEEAKTRERGGEVNVVDSIRETKTAVGVNSKQKGRGVIAMPPTAVPEQNEIDGDMDSDLEALGDMLDDEDQQEDPENDENSHSHRRENQNQSSDSKLNASGSQGRDGGERFNHAVGNEEGKGKGKSNRREGKANGERIVTGIEGDELYGDDNDYEEEEEEAQIPIGADEECVGNIDDHDLVGDFELDDMEDGGFEEEYSFD